MTEQEFQKELLSAFRGIGYSDYMIEEKNVSFSYKNGHPPHTAKAILYSSQFRKDLETAVIAVQETQNANKLDIETELKPYETLGTPIIILAEYRKLKTGNEPLIVIYDLMKERALTSKAVISFQEFQDYIKKNRDNFSPRKLEDKKVEPFQQKLPLFKTALELTNKELVQVYELGMKSIFKNEKDETHKVELYRNSLRLLAARILRDKANENWSLDSASKLIRDAKIYNSNYFQIPPELLKKLDPLISNYLSSEFNFSHIGLETLGYFYEQAVLSSKVKQAQGIYYTSSIIAKTILKRMPIEEIRPENRILLDPTCGSGSFLVAGYERLTQMAYLKESPDVRHQRLIKSIFGNEKDPIAAEIAKLTLMLFHPPHKNNWNVFIENAKEENFTRKILTKLGNKRPSIIVGNLPFKFEQTDKDKQYADNVKRSGHTQEGSSIILSKCLELLQENGLIGLILPENILSYTHPKDIQLRQTLIREFQILDQIKIPTGWFKDANHPALVWILRKKSPDLKIINLIQLNNLPISIEDIPINVREKNVQLSKALNINIDKPPKRLIIGKNINISGRLNKLEFKIKNFYEALLGFELKSKKLIKDKNETGSYYVWSSDARNTNPFSSLKNNKKFIELHLKNFPDASPRRNTIAKVIKNRNSVIYRVNRNNPELYNWSSIALLDIVNPNEKSIAPSYSFYPTYTKQDFVNSDLDYIYALWIVLNHPIVSELIRNLSDMRKINTDDYRNIPLPDCWDDIDKIKTLASKSKQLLDLKLRYDSKYKSDDAANKSNPSKSKEELRNKILLLVKETDKIIYDMYNFTKSEIQQIEDFFGNEKRPGLEELGEEWKQFKPVKKREKKVPSIDPNELKDFGTSFETIEVNYEKLQVKLIVNGLRDREDGIDVDQEGIWLPITPYMPGWMLRPGANGMIYLKTYDSVLIQEFPEYFIKDFSLMKNAYKTIEEIEENVFREAKDQGREVG